MPIMPNWLRLIILGVKAVHTRYLGQEYWGTPISIQILFKTGFRYLEINKCDQINEQYRR